MLSQQQLVIQSFIGMLDHEHNTTKRGEEKRQMRHEYIKLEESILLIYLKVYEKREQVN